MGNADERNAFRTHLRMDPEHDHVHVHSPLHSTATMAMMI